MSNYLTTQIPKVIDPITYSKPPLPPQGEAAWLKNSVHQPYFTPYDQNQYNVPFVNVSTYFKAPTLIFVSYNTISQPVNTITSLIPSVINPLKALVVVVIPTGYASWASKNISQPYFDTWNENLYGIQPVNVGTYFNPPPPPNDIASSLNKTISQPYFTPYDENSLVWPADIGTYFKAPPPPVDYATWLTKSIHQPYILPYNELDYGIQPVNVGTYYKAPPPPKGVASWLKDNVSQPYFTPYNPDFLVWNPNAGNLRKIFTSFPWLSTTIAQPYFTPYDVNSYVWDFKVGNYSKPVPPPSDVASWLTNSVSQPYFPFRQLRPYEPFVRVVVKLVNEDWIKLKKTSSIWTKIIKPSNP